MKHKHHNGLRCRSSRHLIVFTNITSRFFVRGHINVDVPSYLRNSVCVSGLRPSYSHSSWYDALESSSNPFAYGGQGPILPPGAKRSARVIRRENFAHLSSGDTHALGELHFAHASSLEWWHTCTVEVSRLPLCFALLTSTMLSEWWHTCTVEVSCLPLCLFWLTSTMLSPLSVPSTVESAAYIHTKLFYYKWWWLTTMVFFAFRSHETILIWTASQHWNEMSQAIPYWIWDR